MGKKLKFSIIVPVHNQFNLLDQCIQSIIAKTTQDYEIIISDSNSDQKLSEYYGNLSILKQNTNIKIIEDAKDPGFTRAVNNGLKVADNDADYYVLLNSDTIVTKGWLTGIRGKDLCSPISNNATYQSMLCIDVKDLPTVEKFLNNTKKIKPLKTDFLNGFCYIISKKVLKDIGYLDEKYFPHYGSEDDYSLRAKLKGYQAYVLPNNYVYHVGNQSYDTSAGSKLRQNGPVFLSRFPKAWFDSLIMLHTVKTRNLRQQIVEAFVEYVQKGL